MFDLYLEAQACWFWTQCFCTGTLNISFSLSAPTWTQVVKIDTQFQIKKKTQKPRKAAFFETTQSV